jgi:hypothetical protein
MTAIRRPTATGCPLQASLMIMIFVGVAALCVLALMVPHASTTESAELKRLFPAMAREDFNKLEHALVEEIPKEYRFVAERAERSLRSTVQHKREQLAKALDSLNTHNLPGRLQILRDKSQIVGERLADVKAGKETVQEILTVGADVLGGENPNEKPPMKLDEIVDYFDGWIHGLHEVLSQFRTATYEGIWQAYHDYTVKTLYVWDREYLSRMPPRRDDGSIYLSLATYRDENCINTITWAYEKAKNPDKLFVGLVQQNCHTDCMSGVLEGGKTEPVEPDEDCYKLFCEGKGKERCERGQVRVLNVDEPESLGPYAARYFASKMWMGEQWYMQTDAHMTFGQDWDEISVDMLQRCPSGKPVISHYPPSHEANLEAMATKPASRLCGPMFATSDLESQIVRLEGAKVSWIDSSCVH